VHDASSPPARIHVPSIHIDPAANYHPSIRERSTEDTRLPHASHSPPVADPNAFRRYRSHTDLSAPAVSEVFRRLATDIGMGGSMPMHGMRSARAEHMRGSPPLSSSKGNSSRPQYPTPHSIHSPFCGGERDTSTTTTASFRRQASSLHRTPTPLRALTPVQRQATLFVRLPSAFPATGAVREGRENERTNTPPSSKETMGAAHFPSHAPSPPMQSHPSPPSKWPATTLHSDPTSMVVPIHTTTAPAKSTTKKDDLDPFMRIPTTKNFERLCSLHPPSRLAGPLTPKGKGDGERRGSPSHTTAPVKASSSARMRERHPATKSPAHFTASTSMTRVGCMGTRVGTSSTKTEVDGGRGGRDLLSARSGRATPRPLQLSLSPSSKAPLSPAKRGHLPPSSSTSPAPKGRKHPVSTATATAHDASHGVLRLSPSMVSPRPTLLTTVSEGREERKNEEGNPRVGGGYAPTTITLSPAPQRVTGISPPLCTPDGMGGEERVAKKMGEEKEGCSVAGEEVS